MKFAHRSGSIFRHSFLLATGGAIALAGASIALVLSQPAPFIFPLSTLELVRLFAGEPIANTRAEVERTIAMQPPVSHKVPDAFDAIIHEALARQLAVPSDAVFFATLEKRAFPGLRTIDPARTEYERITAYAATLYGKDERFAPLVFGSFQAALRQSDGRWVVLESADHPGPQWQWAFVKWIGLVLLLIVPIAWLASKRLAGPIQAFAAAADRIGGGSFERVEVGGPEEIRKAAAALNEMQARLEHHVKERTAAMGAIAHDLRTPLARLTFHLAQAPAEVRQSAEAEIAGMERMIAVSLDFVASETVPPQPEPVDLRLLVEGVVDDFADLGRDARVDLGEPIIVNGDPVLLRRLFTNLVGNALDYGREARVRLAIEAHRAVVEIADAGPGLPENDLERVFEPYYRGEASRSHTTGGIGLGLAVVRSIARAHGGVVSLANRREGGLLARVTLPLAALRAA